MKETIRNQWYMVKFCMEASPLHFLYHIVICVGLEIFIFLEHTVWIGYNLDAAEQNRDFSRVLVMTVGMVVLLAFHQLCSSIYFYWSTTKIKPLLYQKLQARIYEKAKAVDIACYDDPQYYNEFILSTTQANQCIDRFYDDSYSVIRYVTCLLIDFVYLSVNSWASLIVVLICFLSKFWSSRAYYRLVTNKKLDANISERKRKYQHRVFYLHDYAKELRINKKIGDMLMQDFQDCNEELAQLNRRYGRRLAIYGFIKDYLSGNFIIYAIYLPILIFVYQTYGGVTLSGIVILNNMVRYMSKRGNKLAELAPQLEMNSTFIGKIRSFLGYQVKIKDGEESMQEEFEELTLENVSFAYTQGGREILHDINMQIRKGQKIAIVGYNGAGKSTLVKLLLRLYDPTGGEIRRNGRNIQEFRLKDYQGDFGTVFQDYKMYAATIRENVVMDVCEHSKEETYQVEKALHRARFAVDDYKLKYQIDTPLTTEFEAQGVNLSGGEGQKVAIARSFYRNKAVMIMDEPSSALDPMAEYQLNQAIHQIAEDKTVIFISHRLSTTRDADCIYMMENGRIIEHGTHEELINSGGKYSKMWNVQAGRYI